MRTTLSGYRLAMIGGDRREKVAARVLAQSGARVRLVDPLSGDQQLAAKGADAVIYPVRGMDEQGRIACEQGYGPLVFDERALTGVRSGGLIIIGSAGDQLSLAARRYSLAVVELLSCDHFSILNAIPTAEGAIAAAIEAMPVTVHGCQMMVVGYGRCGRELADRLRSLGASTLVAARSSKSQATAFATGHEVISISEIGDRIAECRAVFNTVPAPIIGAPLLSRAGRGSFLFELASLPGAFDRDAADRCGLAVIDLPGLPGKVAPESAGKYLAQAAAAVITTHIPAPA